MKLTTLIQKCCDRYDRFSKDIDFSLSTSRNYEEIIRNILKGQFIPPEATNIALKTISTMWISNYVLNGHSIKVTILQPQSNKKRAINLLHFVNRIISIIDGLNPVIVKQPVAIYLFDLDFPKVYLRGEIPSPKHINTGVRYGENVVVYRSEEMGKVLIHELLHRFGFEISSLVETKLQQIEKFFSVNNLIINEAYVDMLAIIINTIYFSLYKSSHKSGLHDLWLQEVQHIMRKANCLSQIYKNEFKDAEIHEKTNGICYYIIKAMIISGLKTINSPILIHSGQSRSIQTANIDKLLDGIIRQFKVDSKFWKLFFINRNSPCRHNCSLRMSTLDCI